MRHLKNLLLMVLLPLVGVVLFASCEKDPNTDKGNDKEQTPGNDDPEFPDVEKDSVIVLAQKSISAAVAGDTCFMEYDITNPHQGEKITLTSAEDWVSDFDTSLSGAFSFKVAANDGNEAREALVTVSYRYAEDVVFTVKQSALTKAGFTVEQITGVEEYFSFTVNIFPENKTLPYIVMSASPSYIEEFDLYTSEALYQDDYDYFEWLGSFHGETAVGIMQLRAKVGDAMNITIDSATPGDTYILYCYYFDYDSGALISEVNRFEIVVDHPTVKEVPDTYYTFNYEIEGPRVHTDVKSSTADNYYYDVMTKAELDLAVSKGYTREEYVQLWWSRIVAGNVNDGNYTPYDFMAANTCQGTRKDEVTGEEAPRSTWSYDLAANTDYYLFAFNMDDNALCVTKPILHPFKTGSVEPSDNQITIEVDGVTAYRAEVNITATYDKSEENYRHAYVSHYATKDEWSKFGTTDAARMDYIRKNVPLEYMWGDNTVVYSNLKADTEYVVYAFGMYGGVVTTQLWTKSFTTKSDAPGEVDITLKDLGYYDSTDLATLPGLESFAGDSKAILPVSIEFSKKNHGDFFFSIYDWTGRYDELPDDQYLAGLLWSIETYGSFPATDTYVPLDWDGRYVAVAIVVDANGQYSKLMKREYNTSYAGAEKDLTKFTSWWDSWHGGVGLQSLVVTEAPKAETKGNVIEVDASISKVKAAPTYLKASQCERKAKETTPEPTALNATR